MRTRATLLLAMTGVMGACAHPLPPPAVPEAVAEAVEEPALQEDAPADVIVTVPVAHTLSMLHARLSGHESLPDHEWVMCLRGEMQGERVIVDDVGAARVVKLLTEGVVHLPCSTPRYLGIWHPHPPSMVPPERAGSGCYFSDPDVTAFLKDQAAVVALVSCDDGQLMAMRKDDGETMPAVIAFTP